MNMVQSSVNMVQCGVRRAQCDLGPTKQNKTEIYPPGGSKIRPVNVTSGEVSVGGRVGGEENLHGRGRGRLDLFHFRVNIRLLAQGRRGTLRV